MAEFAYNRTSHSTTSYSPFFVVYGFNPLTPLDLSDFPTDLVLDFGAEKKAQVILELHAEVWQKIKKTNEHNARVANKHRKEIVFQPGDYVWAHLRKLRFPTKRESKLGPRGDGQQSIQQKGY